MKNRIFWFICLALCLAALCLAACGGGGGAASEGGESSDSATSSGSDSSALPESESDSLSESESESESAMETVEPTLELEADVSEREDGSLLAQIYFIGFADGEPRYWLHFKGEGRPKSVWNPVWGGFEEDIALMTADDAVLALPSLESEALLRVEFPASQERVGERAYSLCPLLREVVIPEGMKELGARCFSGCSLESVILPDSLTVIGESAFSGCKSLVSVQLGAGLSDLGNGAFSGCKSLASVQFGAGLRNLGERAFSGCHSLSDVALPEGLLTVKSQAFSGCKMLISVCIPASLTVMEDSVFIECERLASFSVAEGSEHFSARDGVLYNKDQSLLVCYPSAKSGEVFAVPDSVRQFLHSAFEGSSLKELILPALLTEISDGAFYSMKALERIEIPKGVKKIGLNAFLGCSALETLTLPEGLTSIGRAAFSGCRALKILVIPKGVSLLPVMAFFNCESLSALVLPSAITMIDELAFSVVKEDLTLYYCGTEAQWGRISIHSSNSTHMKGFTLVFDCETDFVPGEGGEGESGSGGESGGENGWDGEERPPLPATPPEVAPDSSYAGLSYSTGLEFEVVEYKGKYRLAVVGMGVCKDSVVVIPEKVGDLSVTMINRNAFFNCEEIRRIILPDTLEIIRDNAFAGCASLESLTVPASVTELGTIFFGAAMPGLARLEVEEGNAVYYDVGNSIVERATGRLVVGSYYSVIPDDGSVTTVASDAFASHYGETLVVPHGVTKIEDEAFGACLSMKYLVLTNTVTEIGSAAFGLCMNLETVYYEGTQAEWEALLKNVKNGNDDLLAARVVFCYEIGE